MSSSPLPTTPKDIIELALKMVGAGGVGQTPSDEDANDSFNVLNMMMAQWQRRRYMVYQLVNYSLIATGQQVYTVGIGGDFNVERPSKIESAFFRQISESSSGSVDSPLTILRAREDYDRISSKGLTSSPEYLFYDAGYPLANLYIWPIPSSVDEIHLTVMQQIQKFQGLSDQIMLPEEYKAALLYNLAVLLYPMYGQEVNPVVATQAQAAISIIEQENSQIPRLQMPSFFQRGAYNIYGDLMTGAGA